MRPAAVVPRGRPSSGRLRFCLASLLLAGCATGAGQRAPDDGEGHDDTAKRALADSASFRASGHVEAAVAGLDRLLKQITAWGGADTLSPATRATLETELEASRAFVRDIGAKETAAGHPLAAEAELRRLAPLLAHPELADASAAAAGRARDAGRAVCTRLQTTLTPAAPHWGQSVSHYCHHFDVALVAPPSTQEPSAFVLDGTLAGLTAAETTSLRARLQNWLRASFWTEPGGAVRGRGTMQGKVESSFQHQSVTLHAPYEDTITAHSINGRETVEERPIARYLGEERTSSATTDRVFEYDAEESRGHYSLMADVSLDLGEARPVTFSLRHTENLKAYDHDVTFEKAGIRPVHDRVPTSAAWLDGQLDRMSTRVVTALNRRFVSLHCARQSYDLDEAARCLAIGQRPPAALAVVTDALGDDAERALPILRPAPPPVKPAAPAKAAPRKPAPRAAAGAQDDENPVIE
jgi:hypothetical protein